MNYQKKKKSKRKQKIENWGRKLAAFSLILTLVLTSFVGCGNKKEENPFAAREARISNGELIAALCDEPEAGFDSTTGGHGSMTRVFFSTLFKRDKALGWENDLATDYTVSPDRLTWTVHIRPDVKFTDGEPLTAEDVVFTYEKTKVAGGEIDLTMLEKVEKIDEHTVAFILNKPYSPFMERLAYLGIVPKHAYGEGFKDSPIGSGPYKFVQWDKGQQVIAQINEDYYGDAPALKQLTLVFLEADAAFGALKQGSVDVVMIDGNLAEQKAEGTEIHDIASIECYGICFPMQKAEGKKDAQGAEIGNDVTCDPAIRQALTYAVDRQKMLDGILNGYGTISTTGLEGMPWLDTSTQLDPTTIPDIEKAKGILAAAGWKDTDGDGIVEKGSLKAEFELLYVSALYRQELALEFANAAKEIGIQVNLEKTTWDTIGTEVHKKAVLYGFGSGDPSEIYNQYYGPCAGGVIPWDNSGCYMNPEVDKNIELALAAEDEEEALKYWKAAQKQASPSGDVPYCWLVNANHVYLSAEGFTFGKPLIQPHGGRIFDNVTEWAWN